ncbi:putative amino acid permease YhdG [Thalassovita gelatinovora]|uniref:Putative amino acid permease YhdG n=1 Tax=Thalassovita gelatinovora TaxID=53501 RepID=A0A0P1FFD7_THAGE|nr:amino acid permease [Thalassovita gelatinovora]QIZ79951.1 amino acid permease [Thalassovita gelatinovora]CUH66486.1 putative amino acid permease YhdG [Thalassovita gelatinovora]SER13310.1 amino acid/polyamine/organocation transporter, APC superfamily [Thalassovita gelatinovora]
MAEALKRRIGPVVLTLYGIGIMVGAGIYVLTGAAVGAAGMWAPLAFVLAGLVAIPSALSFAELSARIPEAAGDSAYIEKGLGLHWLAVVVGLINVGVGTVAAAAVLRGGVGYLLALVDIPFVWGVVGLGVLLTIVALIGVLESLSFAAVLTVIEIAGLGMVIWAGFSAAPVADYHLPLPSPEWSGIALATIFAFFAFIGFDDIVNVAEETRSPVRTMPIAILTALAVTALLYALVSLAAIRAVPRDLLAVSDRPLALVWEAGAGRSAAFLSAIAVAAALNGVLAQIVMASRVLYGLGKRSLWLAMFRRTSPHLGTPVLGTVLIGAATIGAALTLPVAVLAEGSTLALLVVFAIVNAALIGVKRKHPDAEFKVPAWMPWLGVLSCIAAFAASLVGRFG